MAELLPIAPAAQAEPAPAAAEQWLTVDRAVALGVSRSTAYRAMREGVWVWREGAGGRELLLESLPEKVREEHRRRDSGGCLVAGELPAAVDNQLAYQEAGRRWELLQRWEELSGQQRRGEAGAAILRAWAEAPAELVAHCRSLGEVPRWGSLDRVMRKVRTAFDRGENGVLLTLGRLVPRAVTREQTLPDPARAYICKLWLTHRASTARMVWRTYLAEARRPGRGWPEVSYDTVRRLVADIPADLEVMARRGMREYRGKAGRFIQRDFSSLAAGQEWVGDHRQLDAFVRCETTGRLFRPWVTGWLDHASRVLIGWVMRETPNSRTITAAFAHGVRPKRREEYRQVCGAPSSIYMDNGKDYRCKAIEGEGPVFKAGMDAADIAVLKGLFPSLGIEVHHAAPYNAKAKIIERFFRTMSDDFCPRLPGYCGHTTVDRSDRCAEEKRRHQEWLEGKRRETPILTLQQVSDLFELWLVEYHRRNHDELSSGGRRLAPLDAWRLYGKDPVMVQDSSLELLCMEALSGGRTVQKNGLQINGLWYWCDALLDHLGGSVEVRLDPVEAGRVYVFTVEGKFLSEAVSDGVLRAGASPEDVAQKNREKRRFERRRREALRVLQEDAPEGTLDLISALQETIPPPLAEPVMPERPIRKLMPVLDRVELRQAEPPVPVRQPVEIIDVASESAPKTQRKLFLFASEREWEEEHGQLAAERG